MSILHINAKPTLLGESIVLTEDEEKNCRLLYKKDENNRYKFAGYYNPDICDDDYEDGYISVPLRSVYGGLTTFNKGKSVWNVKGSTEDKFDNKATVWKQVWLQKAKKNEVDLRCYVAGSVKYDHTDNCNRIIYGGHMITTSEQPQKGDDGKVYIIPICNSHNNSINTEAMFISEDVTAVILNRYLTI